MTVYDRIKSLIPRLDDDDGSKKLAESWLGLISDASEIHELLNQKTFRKIIAQMRADFRARLEVKIEDDPELKAMRRMFIRTIGLSGAEEQISKALDEMIDGPDERDDGTEQVPR